MFNDPHMMGFARQILKNSSKRVAKVPKFLYHASPVQNHGSILRKGLVPSDMFGEIYLCDTPEKVERFMETEKGKYNVYQVNARNLPKKDLRISMDTDKDGEECEVYSYYNSIPTSLVRLHEEK